MYTLEPCINNIAPKLPYYNYTICIIIIIAIEHTRTHQEFMLSYISNAFLNNMCHMINVFFVIASNKYRTRKETDGVVNSFK